MPRVTRGCSCPTPFDLEDPSSWFATEVKPRIERRQDRALWRLTWEGSSRRDRPPAPAGAQEEESQKGDKPTLKTLWGPKLTTEEVNRARERAPPTEMASCCVGASSPTWAATCRIARGPTSSFGDPLKLWMGQSRCSCLGEEGLRG